MKKYFFILCIFLDQTSFSITPDFKHLTPLDGLNGADVTGIVQDAYGQMWFATWEGLVRYDGYEIKNYKSVSSDPQSIPTRQVASLFKDSHDNLWLVTADGICRYNQFMDNFVMYELEGLEYESLNNAKIHEYNDLLFVCFKGRIYYLETDSIFQKHTFKNYPVRDILNKQNVLPLRFMDIIHDEIWLVKNLRSISGSNRNKVFSGKIDDDNPASLVISENFIIQGTITVIKPYMENQAFIGTTEGLYFFDNRNKQLDLIEAAGTLYISNLLVTSDNKLWISTYKSGLLCLDLHAGNFQLLTHDPYISNSLLGNIILSMYEDFSGNLWIGYAGGKGLSILNLRQKPFETYRHHPNDPFSISTNTIMCFNETPDELLIGTIHDGLVIAEYNQLSGKYLFRNIPMPDNFIRLENRSQRIWKITRESDSIYWLGTNFGLIKAYKKGVDWKFEQFFAEETNSPIREIFIDKNRTIWFGSSNGLFLIPSSKRGSMEYFHFTHSQDNNFSLSDNSITTILLDKSGNFLIGTQNGGVNLLNVNYEALNLTGKYKPELNFIHFKEDYLSDSSLNNNEVNVMHDHPDGNIWIGTHGGGINILDLKTNTFNFITAEDGLAGDEVFSLLPDEDGNLWVSTNKGLSYYNLHEKNIINYTCADGIQGNVFMVNAYFRSNSGKLFFGGRNGFTCFHPASIVLNKIPPKTVLTGLNIMNKKVLIGQEIYGEIILPRAINELSSVTLPYRANNFSIGFSVMHYQNPEGNKAEYMLEGFNKTWEVIPASNKFIEFNNLQHGSYTLKIRGINSDSIESAETKEMRIHILPPWHKTWWAKLIFISVPIFIIAGILALILQRQKLKYLLKIEKIEFENLKELNEAKLRFFTNISHELRTPLSLAITPIEELLLKRNFSESYARKQLNLAQRNAKILIRLINQIMDFRRFNANKLFCEPEEQDITVLLNEVLNNFEVLRIEKNILLSLDIPEEPLVISYDSRKMEHIFFNLLSNAFKFTPKGGAISITIQKDELNTVHDNQNGWLKISFYNDGKEIPENQLEKIFERFHKVDNSSEGSGIGLSFTKSLVELHQGKIYAESIAGKGVRFILSLPFRKTDESSMPDSPKTGHELKSQQSLSSQPMEASSNNDRPKLLINNNNITHLISGKISVQPEKNQIKEPILKSLRENEIDRDVGHEYEKDPDPELYLLIVEDNEELRSLLTAHFEQEYIVLEASNGQDGVELAEKDLPDLIICDILMPVMNGIQLCDRIKMNANTCHIPVILLTAKDEQEFKISGYDHGADAYVTKPFEIAVLEKQMKSLLRNRELIRENYKNNNFVIDISSEKTSKDDLFIAKMKKLIENNLTDSQFNVNNISKHLDINYTNVYRKIKALTGYPPVEFIRIIKLEKAAEMLKSGNYNVKEVCFNTGFNNQSYFTKCFKKHFNVTPNYFMDAYKKNHEPIVKA